MNIITPAPRRPHPPGYWFMSTLTGFLYGYGAYFVAWEGDPRGWVPTVFGAIWIVILNYPDPD